MSTIGRLLDGATSRLVAAGVASARFDAEILLAKALSRGRASLLAHHDEAVPVAAAASFDALVARREDRVPVAYILGVKEFWSLDFYVDENVLIPRPETELVVEESLRILAAGQAHPIVVDVGTGAGPIAIALACERPDTTIHACDTSAPALEVARRNAGRHGVASRIHFHHGDLLAPVLALGPAGRCDLVVSNPPYVGESEPVDEEVRRWEPRAAVFGGKEGGEIILRLIPESAKVLKPGGSLVIEIAAARETLTRKCLGGGGDRGGDPIWSEVRTLVDLAGVPRVIAARRSEAT